LTPSGLQVLLLNVTSGRFNPDYVPVVQHRLAMPLSLILGIVILAGVIFLIRDWSYWWDTLLKDRACGWFVMICIGCVTPVIILTQRPRPSYLLAFGIFLRAAIGVCALAILRRVPRWVSSFERVPWLGPVAAILLIALAPSYYPRLHAPRLLVERYEALAPYRQWLEASDAGLATSSWGSELCSYLVPNAPCRHNTYSNLRSQMSSQRSLNDLLRENRASIFLADDAIYAEPRVQEFLASAEANGWHVLSRSQNPARPWTLLVKPSNLNYPPKPGGPPPDG
jgi:hypothetical protein